MDYAQLFVNSHQFFSIEKWKFRLYTLMLKSGQTHRQGKLIHDTIQMTVSEGVGKKIVTKVKHCTTRPLLSSIPRWQTLSLPWWSVSSLPQQTASSLDKQRPARQTVSFLDKRHPPPLEEQCPPSSMNGILPPWRNGVPISHLWTAPSLHWRTASSLPCPWMASSFEEQVPPSMTNGSRSHWQTVPSLVDNQLPPSLTTSSLPHRQPAPSLIDNQLPPSLTTSPLPHWQPAPSLIDNQLPPSTNSSLPHWQPAPPPCWQPASSLVDSQLPPSLAASFLPCWQPASSLVDSQLPPLLTASSLKLIHQSLLFMYHSHYLVLIQSILVFSNASDEDFGVETRN